MYDGHPSPTGIPPIIPPHCTSGISFAFWDNTFYYSEFSLELYSCDGDGDIELTPRIAL